MKFFIRTVLICLLACIALSEVQAELPGSPRRACINVICRSLHQAQLVIGALAQYSLLRIRVDESSDPQIGDDHAPRKRHNHGKGAADAIVTGESYRLDAGESTNGAVILIGGTGEIYGTVNGDFVLIGSKATLAGTVNGDLVTIGSNLTFNSGAVANGDYVSVASEVKGEQELTANGERVTLNTYSPVVPFMKEAFTGIVQLRPMAPTSIFSWTLAITMLIVRLMLGLIFPKVFAGTEVIVRDRPGPSLLVGLADDYRWSGPFVSAGHHGYRDISPAVSSACFLDSKYFWLHVGLLFNREANRSAGRSAQLRRVRLDRHWNRRDMGTLLHTSHWIHCGWTGVPYRSRHIRNLSR